MYELRIGGKYMGVYSSVDEAVKIREHILKNKLSPSHIRRYNTSSEDRYIYKQINGNFGIIKRVNGRAIRFGTYHSLEDARCERDFWESIDWDFDLLDLH